MYKTFCNLPISFPDYFFINCHGSYVVSVFKYFAGDQHVDDLLFFMADCKLISLNLDLEHTIETSNRNPWRFQLLRIANSENTPLFSGNTIDEFFEFLEKNFDIKTRRIPGDNPEFAIQQFINSVSKGFPVMINIDEYYNPSNANFFKKVHNIHSVLITGYDSSTRSFKVVDTEFKKPYFFDEQSLKDSLENSIFRKEYIEFSCENYTNKVNKDERSLVFFQEDRVSNHLENFYEYFKKQYISDEYEYIYKSLMFTINYQIIPFIKARSLNSKLYSSELKEKIELSSKQWNNLRFLILKKLKLNDSSVINLHGVIEKIISLEKEIENLAEVSLSVYLKGGE
jgi:hypothetical protein